jgi:hypothetical protein
MTRTGSSTTDQHIRAAERAAYEHFGLDPTSASATSRPDLPPSTSGSWGWVPQGR